MHVHSRDSRDSSTFENCFLLNTSSKFAVTQLMQLKNTRLFTFLIWLKATLSILLFRFVTAKFATKYIKSICAWLKIEIVSEYFMKNVNDIHNKLGLTNSTKGSEADKYCTCKKRCSKLVKALNKYYKSCFSADFRQLLLWNRCVLLRWIHKVVHFFFNFYFRFSLDVNKSDRGTTMCSRHTVELQVNE